MLEQVFPLIQFVLRSVLYVCHSVVGGHGADGAHWGGGGFCECQGPLSVRHDRGKRDAFYNLECMLHHGLATVPNSQVCEKPLYEESVEWGQVNVLVNLCWAMENQAIEVGRECVLVKQLCKRAVQHGNRYGVNNIFKTGGLPREPFPCSIARLYRSFARTQSFSTPWAPFSTILPTFTDGLTCRRIGLMGTPGVPWWSTHPTL